MSDTDGSIDLEGTDLQARARSLRRQVADCWREPRLHSLKIWPSEFNAVLRGIKTHEWRRNDRDFQVGDRLELMEYWPSGIADGYQRGEFTGRTVWVEVTWVSKNFGVPDGWCVLSIASPQLRYDCPNCGNDQFTSDPEHGLMVCDHCSHVIE